jgi:rubredoxin
LTRSVSSVRAAKELAKDSSDTELKERIAEVYDSFLDIKDRVLDLDLENRTLKEQLAKRATFKRTSEFGYYFADGDPDPYCPKCYEGAGKEIHLRKAIHTSGGRVTRGCRECGYSFIESRGAPSTPRRSPWG